jgi:DNA-binding MarR family transcriptional regulator
MKIEEAIKQEKFRSEYQKMAINILYTAGWVDEVHSKVLKKYNLTGPQYNVLRILRGQSPNPATINLIIDRMLDKMSNASRIVDRLESKGWVERKICPSDRRACDVSITKKGLELLAELDKEEKKWEVHFKNLSEKEASELNFLLDKLRSREKSDL